MLDLRSIRFTMMAVQSRSFRGAAAALGIEQSALSRTIQALENTLGVSLFERHSGGVRLTKAGERFSVVASRILADVDILRAEAESAGEAKSGQLTIGIDLPLTAGELGTMIDEHRSKYRDVEIRLLEDTRSRLAEALTSRAVDVAIMGALLQDRSFDTMPLWKQPIMVVLPKKHGLVSKKIVRVDDLLSQQLLFNRSDTASDVQSFLSAEFMKIGKRPTMRVHYASAETIRNLVGLGHGITFLFDSCESPGERSVARRPLYHGKTRCFLQCYACWDHRNDNPALRRFISYLKTRYPSRRSKPGAA